MVRKTEKLESFCKKFEVIPSVGLANLTGQITFKMWHDQFERYPKVENVDMNKMFTFSFSGTNHPLEFLQAKKDVQFEIEDNLIEASNEYELKKYFVHIRKKLDDIFFSARWHVEKLARVTFDAELDDFKNLDPDESAKCYIFYVSMIQAKQCFEDYLALQTFIEDQENLYLSKPETIEAVEIDKISDSLSHKILLLHELGVVEYLQKEFFHAQQTLRNGTDLANLLSNIIGEPTKSETIRKHLSGIHSKGKDSIVTNPGIKEVKKFLSQFNMPLKRLKEKD